MGLSSLLWPNHPYVTVFGKEIYWYAIIIVCGMIAAFFIISLLFKRRNMSADLFLTYFTIGLPIAIITTRMFYCITDGMPISEWFSFASIRNGGLSIVGGIIGGAGSVIVISIVKKVNFFRVGDCVVVGLLFAQAIGRWGNFVNQEVYGAEVVNPSLQWFPFAVFIEDTETWHYAFFFYESLVTLTASVLLFINAWTNGKKPNGINTACYFIVYGLTRSVMEPLRDPSYILGNGIPWSLIMSLLMLIAGIAMLFYVLYVNKRTEGKLIGSKNGEAYGIVSFIGDKKDETAYLTKINMMCKVYPENYVKEEKNGDKKKKEEPVSAANEKKTVEWKAVKTPEDEENVENTNIPQETEKETKE